MLKLIPPLIFVLLCACSGTPARTPKPSTPPISGADFSGHWEMDYGRSDDVNEKLQIIQREWQRAAQRNSDKRNQGPSVDYSRAFSATIILAQMADMITEAQVLDIEQSDIDIEIRRENDFALTCVFSKGKPQAIFDELGAEVCGWDGKQLVFHMRMPDGLVILHRMSISSGRDRLHIATTVDNERTDPFTLNRFYYRFNPLPENYSCEYTLSKGNVCQSGAP